MKDKYISLYNCRIRKIWTFHATQVFIISTCLFPLLNTFLMSLMLFTFIPCLVRGFSNLFQTNIAFGIIKFNDITNSYSTLVSGYRFKALHLIPVEICDFNRLLFHLFLFSFLFYLLDSFFDFLWTNCIDYINHVLLVRFYSFSIYGEIL